MDGGMPSQATTSKQSVHYTGWFPFSWQMSICILKSLDKRELFLHLTPVCISKQSVSRPARNLCWLPSLHSDEELQLPTPAVQPELGLSVWVPTKGTTAQR